MFILKGKGSFYIAQYPVRSTAQGRFTLLPVLRQNKRILIVYISVPKHIHPAIDEMEFPTNETWEIKSFLMCD